MSKLNASSYFNTPNALGGYTISQSLRFGAETGGGYLSKTFGQNGTDWTWSAWVKRSSVGFHSALFYSSSTSNPYYQAGLTFNGSDELEYYQFSNANAKYSQAKSTAKFRDVSAWYHIVAQYDEGGNTTLYVNGEQVAQASNGSTHRFINKTTYPHYIGNYTYQSNPGGNFHGYMAEVHFVDGSLLEPEDFAVSEAGIWLPKLYEGSHGTNGFYIPCDDSSDIGADRSGNGNDFTATTLVSTDVLSDTPSNNWSTLNPLIDVDGNATISEGALKFDNGSNGKCGFQSTFAMSEGHWYVEARCPTLIGGIAVGIVPVETNIEVDTGGGDIGSNANNGIAIRARTSGSYTFYNEATGSETFSTQFTDGGIIGIEIDIDNDTLKFYADGTLAVTITSQTLSGTTWNFAIANETGSNSKQATVNFGQDSTFNGAETAGGNTDTNGNGDFHTSVPSGALALCSKNLPEPSISPINGEQPSDYFNTVLYTGNGSTNNITGVGFKPDWTWLKSRSNAQGHNVFDVIRGANKALFPNDTNAEFTDTDRLTSFDSDGFSLGGDANVNTSSATYVSWNWLAGGTAVSNTDGGVTSQVSANTKAGFSIVSYTAASSLPHTVGHGLDEAPELVIYKNRDSSEYWLVGWDGQSGKGLKLNDTVASFTTSGWNTMPTATTINHNINTNDDYVAYCFHSVPGYSKIGQFEGNGSSDGMFVYTGFRPSWLMVRAIDKAAGWHMFDNKRAFEGNEIDVRLEADNADAENTSGPPHMDLLSNGFKLRTSFDNINHSDGTHLYLAFAEQPFKYSNAR